MRPRRECWGLFLFLIAAYTRLTGGATDMRFFAVGIATISLLASWPCNSAEIKGSTNHETTFNGEGFSCNIFLHGPIVAGDAAALRTVLQQGYTLPVLCLDSPGGNFSEGIALAQLLLETPTQTIVPAGAHCFSACAIIFMAGNSMSSKGAFPYSQNAVFNACENFNFWSQNLSAIGQNTTLQNSMIVLKMKGQLGIGTRYGAQIFRNHVCFLDYVEKWNIDYRPMGTLGSLDIGWKGDAAATIRRTEFPISEEPELKATTLFDWMVVPANTPIRDLR
jgi:hypothetical protein